METILLVVLIVIAIAMIGLVLLQRSEGGALGIGGPGAMFSARGTANLLTRATAGLAAAFMILSLVLAILSGSWAERESVLDTVEEDPLAVETELPLPGELDLPTDIDALDLPEDDRPAVPRAE